MGTRMATRLLEAGHDITVWNRTAERTRPLADRGASVAATPARAVEGVEAAITILTDPAALAEVVLGADGVATGFAAGRLLIADRENGHGQARRRVGHRRVESGHYPPDFKLSLALKDMPLVDQVAERAGPHLGVASATRDWLERAALEGAADLDYSSVIATIVSEERKTP